MIAPQKSDGVIIGHHWFDESNFYCCSKLHILSHLAIEVRSFGHGRLREVPSGNLTWLWKDPPFFMGKFTISMVIFHSYGKLPEGLWNDRRTVLSLTVAVSGSETVVKLLQEIAAGHFQLSRTHSDKSIFSWVSCITANIKNNKNSIKYFFTCCWPSMFQVLHSFSDS